MEDCRRVYSKAQENHVDIDKSLVECICRHIDKVDYIKLSHKECHHIPADNYICKALHRCRRFDNEFYIQLSRTLDHGSLAGTDNDCDWCKTLRLSKVDHTELDNSEEYSPLLLQSAEL